jgi:hypothetical protein
MSGREFEEVEHQRFGSRLRGHRGEIAELEKSLGIHDLIVTPATQINKYRLQSYSPG